MGDCYLYNLKGVKFDSMEAHRLYALAAELYQPEAMSYMAGCKYKNLVKSFYYLPQPHEYPCIPPEMKILIDRNEYERMWYWLERVAIMDWVTPFLVSQTQQADKLGTWPLSNIVKDAMKRRASGKILALQFNLLIDCSNEICGVHLDSVTPFHTCARCLKDLYCSKLCKKCK